METTLTILGCGSSGGVPRVGNDWGACNPSDPRNRRRRCSALVSRSQQVFAGGEEVAANANANAANAATTVLVDTSPDLREQLLLAETSNLDAVLYTHSHADHIHGLDDLRPLAMRMGRSIEAFADETTAQDLQRRFGYAFTTPRGSDYPPFIQLNNIAPGQRLELVGAGGSVAVDVLAQQHGRIGSLGFRFDGIAYCVDTDALSDATLESLRGIDVWVVDALRYAPHPSHAHLAMTLEWIKQVRPRVAILTDMHVDMDYEELSARLPRNSSSTIIPACDGMVVKVTAGETAGDLGTARRIQVLDPYAGERVSVTINEEITE